MGNQPCPASFIYNNMNVYQYIASNRSSYPSAVSLARKYGHGVSNPQQCAEALMSIARQQGKPFVVEMMDIHPDKYGIEYSAPRNYNNGEYNLGSLVYGGQRLFNADGAGYNIMSENPKDETISFKKSNVVLAGLVLLGVYLINKNR